MKKTYRIALVASEIDPYSKSGGLADVTGALAKELMRQGHDVIVITPYYGFIKKQEIPIKSDERGFSVQIGYKQYNWGFKTVTLNDRLRIHFVANQDLFGSHARMYGYEDDALRFMIFNHAALRLLDVLDYKPDVIHSHDWHAGLIPNILAFQRAAFPSLEKTATVFTIHNPSYQGGGDWPFRKSKFADDGKEQPPVTASGIRHMNFVMRGIIYADILNTVSERYAQEILTPEFGMGLEKYLLKRKRDFFGIINGIDYAVFNPSFDENIPVRYDWNSLGKKKKNKLALQKLVGLEQNEQIPVIGVVNRLTEQKGFNLIMECIGPLLRMDLQIVVVGSGMQEYVKFFTKVAKENPKKFGFYSPFTNEMASRVYAGSDMFLMPSRFEPCGISQMISLRYGSIPIVHATGGLSDTISDFNPKKQTGNGFVFKTFTREDFIVAIARALESYKYGQVWEYLIWRAMQQSYSWELPAKKYVKLYQLAIKKRT